VGSPSTAQSVTLSNTGNETLTITSIVPSGDFTQMNNCGTSVADGRKLHDQRDLHTHCHGNAKWVDRHHGQCSE
jgi:hypothetical protein